MTARAQTLKQMAPRDKRRGHSSAEKRRAEQIDLRHQDPRAARGLLVRSRVEPGVHSQLQNAERLVQVEVTGMHLGRAEAGMHLVGRAETGLERLASVMSVVLKRRVWS